MKKKWLLILPLLAFGGLSPSIYKYVHTHFILPDVTVAGFISMADGLGRISVEVIDTLKDDFDVHFQKTRSIHDLQDVPKGILNILKNRNRPLGKVVLFEDTLSEPLEAFQKVFQTIRKNQIRLSYSMFETSKIPTSFVNKLHTYFDAVVVADPYNMKSYKHSSVNLPIFTLPLGLELDVFMNAPLKTKAHTPFVFGCCSSCDNRKNYITTIRAFAGAFGDREDVLLKIHARRGTASEIKAVRKEIENLGLHNVTLSIESVDKQQYLKNFQEIDCYVSLSKGEGFSIPPREALALGIPVIASDNTAQSTLCKSGLVRSVPSLIEERAIYEGFVEDDYGFNFNVELDDAVAAFTDVFEHYDTYLALAKQGREWVKQYEYKKLKPLYHTLVKPKKIILGDENLITEDTLITNSKTLYDKYLKLYPSLKP